VNVTLEVVKLAKWLKILRLCLIAAVVAFGVAIIISYIPRRVQQEFTGIELLVLGEQEYEILQTVDIRIDGRVRNGIFSRFPAFNGTFEVCAYDFTLNDATVDISFPRGFFDSGPMLYRQFWRNPSVRAPSPFETLGWIHTDRNFSSFVIHVAEFFPDPMWGGGTNMPGNRIIAAPTTDANIALEMMRSKNLFWCDINYRVVHYPWAGEPGAWFP